MVDHASVRKRLDQLLAEYRHAARTCNEEETSLTSAKERVDTILQAQKLVQDTAQTVQNTVHRRIAVVVSKCLKAVFGDKAYDFQVDFVRRRGKTEADLIFLKNGHRQSPRNASSGGQLDVAALALIVCSLSLALPRRRKLIVADEPLKHINGEEYQERVAGMVSSLARDTGIQFVIASDLPWMEVGKVINMGERTNG